MEEGVEGGRRYATEDLRAFDLDEANAVGMMAGAVAARDEDGDEVDESAGEVGAGSDLKIVVEDGEHGESVEDAKGLCAEAGVGDGEQDAASANGHLVHDDGGERDGHESENESDRAVVARAPCLCRVQNTSCPCSFALVRDPIRVHDRGRQ